MTKKATSDRLEKKKCKYCTGEFQPRRRGQEFCSDDCRFDYHAMKNRAIRKAMIAKGD